MARDETETAQAALDAKRDELQRKAEIARKIVLKQSNWGAGAGLIPSPILDFAAISTLQVNMLSELAELYDVPYKGNLGKTLIAALLGSLVPLSMWATTFSMIKSIPVFGTILGSVTMPAYAWASTYAIGTVFAEHFERGGDLLNVNLEELKKEFKNKTKEAFQTYQAKKKFQVADEPEEVGA